MRFIRSERLSKGIDTFKTWSLEHGCYAHMKGKDIEIEPYTGKPPAFRLYRYAGVIRAKYGTDSVETAVEFLDIKSKRTGIEQLTATAKAYFNEIITEDLPCAERYRDFIDDLSGRERLEGRFVRKTHEGVVLFLIDKYLDKGMALVLIVEEYTLQLEMEVYIA